MADKVYILGIIQNRRKLAAITMHCFTAFGTRFSDSQLLDSGADL